MSMPEEPDELLDAVEAERARRNPARRFILAGPTPTAEEQAAIDAYHAEFPDGLAILRVVVRPTLERHDP